MNGNPIIVESYLKGSVPSYSNMGIESESHSFPFVSGDFESKVIILSDDSDMEKSYGESLSNKVISRDPLETLFLVKSNGGETSSKDLCPLVLTKTEIEVACQRREHVGRFVKIYQGVTGHGPSDVEIARHMECLGRLDVVSWVSPSDYHRANVLAHKDFRLIESVNANMHDLMAAKIVGIFSVLNTVTM